MNQQDLNQISARGISEQQIEHQLEQIKNGFPFLKLEGAAAIGKGIMAPTAQEVEDYEKAWNDYKAEGHKIGEVRTCFRCGKPHVQEHVCIPRCSIRCSYY